MNENPPNRRIFPVDANHVGIRLIVIFGCVAGFVLSLLVVLPFLLSTFGLSGLVEVFVYVAGTIIGTSAIGYISELFVKRVWPSGKSLELDSEGLTLRDRRSAVSIDWSGVTEIYRWHFKISSNRTWVPKGWICVASQVAGGESSVSLYTFLSPTDASKLPNWDQFGRMYSSKVDKAKDVNTEGSETLQKAEKHRWEFGAEVESKYFGEIMELINVYYGERGSSQEDRPALEGES